MLKRYLFILILALLVAVGVAMGQAPVTEQPAHSTLPPVPPEHSVLRTIVLVTPRVDEVWAEGSTHSVTWTASPVKPVDSVLIVLNGKDFKPLVLARFLNKNPLKWTWKKVGPMVDQPTLTVQSYLAKEVVTDSHAFVIGNAKPKVDLPKKNE